MTVLTFRRGDVVLFRRTVSAVGGLSFLSVCSGIEAASVAFNPLGWRAVGFAEIEKFPSAVLAHHYPHVTNYGDFTRIDTRRLGPVDILCGGTPCQAFSVAGARNSLSDSRGNLTLAFVGLAHDLAANNGLRNVVWENVPGVLSTKDNAFGCFLAGLVGAADPFVPAEPAPGPGKSSRQYGWSAKQRAHYIKWPRSGLVNGPKGCAAWRVLDAQYFGLAQRRKRVIVVADFGNGADPAAVLFEPEGVRRDSPPRRETGEGIASTIGARTKGGGGLGTDFDLDGGLRVEGADASEDGTGRGTPIIAFNHNAQACQLPNANRDTSINDALTCSQGAAIAYSVALRASGGGDKPHVLLQSAVRRLTPRECERLQGFQFQVPPTYPGAWRDASNRYWSPDYTHLPNRTADGPRYKALGNSWAVPLFAWLGARIQRLMPPTAPSTVAD